MEAKDRVNELTQDITSLISELTATVEVYGRTEKVNWGHVGDLGRIKQLLREALHKDED